MYRPPYSVPEAVREIITSNNIFIQSLELGIANYTALAEKIKTDVEKLIGDKVNLNTIVVAIKRFADSLEKEDKENQKTHAMRAKLSLTGSIIIGNFQKEDFREINSFLEDFLDEKYKYNLFESENYYTLLAEDVEKVRSMVNMASEKFNAAIKQGLSKIHIALNSQDDDPYYLLSIITSILYNHQIPIHSAFFTINEIVLILAEKDAARAYDLIRMKIIY